MPPTLTGFTVIVTAVEFAVEHTPLCTTARNCAVCVRFPVLSGLEVDAMSVHVVPLSEDCHFIITPVCPLSVIVALVPLQIVAVAVLAVPPTLSGSTLTVAGVELALEHTPL